jgi:predicted DNA-binding protein
MGFLSKSMEETKRMAKEGLDLLATGDSKLVSTEEKRAAAYFKRRKEMEDEKNLVESGRANVAKQILENKDGEFKDFNLPEQYVRKLREGSETVDSLSKNKDVQRMALEYFNSTDKGKEIEASLAADSQQKAGTFKGPEGFGSVIGVGANPVIEKMTQQNELLEEIKDILFQNMNINNGGGVPNPFTERVPVSVQKAGLV